MIAFLTFTILIEDFCFQSKTFCFFANIYHSLLSTIRKNEKMN